MRLNAASAREGSLRSSRSGWRSAFELTLLAGIAIGCGGAGSGGVSGVTPQSIAFTDHGITQHSRNDTPGIIVAADPAATGMGDLVAAQPGRLYIAVFQGEQT